MGGALALITESTSMSAQKISSDINDHGLFLQAFGINRWYGHKRDHGGYGVQT